MRIVYHPNSQNEKLGLKIYNLLVDNFPQSFFVGGMVRDILLHKMVTDVDIATEAKPSDIAKLLSAAGILAERQHEHFGVIIAKMGLLKVEIATLRKDLSSPGRYPKIAFTTSSKIDSNRRDFTINALYLSQKTGKILDFHKGLADIKARRLKFIGDPDKRIKEDALRIVRALRFSFDLDLAIDPSSKKSISKNFALLKMLTKSRIQTELNKIKNSRHKKIIQKIIFSQKFA